MAPIRRTATLVAGQTSVLTDAAGDALMLDIFTERFTDTFGEALTIFAPSAHQTTATVITNGS